MIEIKSREKMHEEDAIYLFNPDNIVYLKKLDKLSGVRQENTDYFLQIKTLSFTTELYFISKELRDEVYDKFKK